MKVGCWGNTKMGQVKWKCRYKKVASSGRTHAIPSLKKPLLSTDWAHANQTMPGSPETLSPAVPGPQKKPVVSITVDHRKHQSCPLTAFSCLVCPSTWAGPGAISGRAVFLGILLAGVMLRHTASSAVCYQCQANAGATSLGSTQLRSFCLLFLENLMPFKALFPLSKARDYHWPNMSWLFFMLNGDLCLWRPPSHYSWPSQAHDYNLRPLLLWFGLLASQNRGTDTLVGPFTLVLPKPAARITEEVWRHLQVSNARCSWWSLCKSPV